MYIMDNKARITFLKLDCSRFIPIITSNVLNYNYSRKREKNSIKKNQFYAYKKHLTQFIKMGSIPRLPIFRHAQRLVIIVYLLVQFIRTIMFTLFPISDLQTYRLFVLFRLDQRCYCIHSQQRTGYRCSCHRPGSTQGSSRQS